MTKEYFFDMNEKKSFDTILYNILFINSLYINVADNGSKYKAIPIINVN